MPPITIRKMMLLIAGLAAVFSVIAWWKRLEDEREKRLDASRCNWNIRLIGLAILGYASSHRATFPSGTAPNPSLPPEDRLSWYAAILRETDEFELYDIINHDQAWHVGINLKVSETAMRILSCPSWGNRPPPYVPRPTPYVGIAGLGTDAPLLPKSDRRAGIFGYDRQTTLADIRDGTAATMMLAESGHVIGSWLQGGPATIRGLDSPNQPYIGPGRQFGGLHDGGAFIAFADGSVRWVSESIDPRVFEALSTIAGGERLPQDWWE